MYKKKKRRDATKTICGPRSLKYTLQHIQKLSMDLVLSIPFYMLQVSKLSYCCSVSVCLAFLNEQCTFLCEGKYEVEELHTEQSIYDTEVLINGDIIELAQLSSVFSEVNFTQKLHLSHIPPFGSCFLLSTS